jgi:selenocysteine lyase/cysteine desulfurase
MTSHLAVGEPDLAMLPTPRPIDPDPAWDGDTVAALRAREYARLDVHGQVYLDYTGGGLYAASQLREHLELLSDGVFGNPHSGSPTSQASTRLADAARLAVLRFLRADPAEYCVVFTANASAALKLVGEAYPFGPGSHLLLTADNHNSVNGIRELARAAGAGVTYLPLRRDDLRHDPAVVLAALDDPPGPGRRGLFAYPAQSNYSGVRHPLDWVEQAHERGWDVLLDASAFVPTRRLDLSRHHPDFVAISWYKVFGYPTGIGCLVARRAALAGLRRPWFAGGTIGVASVVLEQHTLGPAEVGFEDGTINYLGLPAIEIGLRHVESVGLPLIGRRVEHLTRLLLDRLLALRHADGVPLVRLYGPRTTHERGGTVPFNLIDADGGVIDFWVVEAAAAARRISVRTGCFCNPGASEMARGITSADMARVFALGRQPDYADLRALLPGKALGAVRASVGIATTEDDVHRLADFLGDLGSDITRGSHLRPA